MKLHAPWCWLALALLACESAETSPIDATPGPVPDAAQPLDAWQAGPDDAGAPDAAQDAGEPDADLSWRHYPLSIVAGDPHMTFPAAEGRIPEHHTDTWYLAGELQGEQSGKHYAFIAMFIFNRVGGTLPADFYSLSLYDLDEGRYGTFTEYDMPPDSLLRAERVLSTSEGFLAVRAKLSDDQASWQARRDDTGQLVPFTYDAHLPGKDQSGQAMLLELGIEALHPPLPVGADTHKGILTCYGQENTKSYFQTGMHFAGTLRWGPREERVRGTRGHIDRQTMPEYAGVKAGLDGRDRAHEWRNFYLEGGLDLTIWRQFDRTMRNVSVPFSGATTYDARSGAADYSDDLTFETLSYVRLADSPIKPFFPARAAVLYFPDRHRLRSERLGFLLESEPLVPLPLLALPIEYINGPTTLRGTLRGKPVEGFGFFERTLGLYRDFELAMVLLESVQGLPAEALAEPVRAELLTALHAVRDALDGGDRGGAKRLLAAQSSRLAMAAAPYAAHLQQIAADLNATL